MPSAISQKSRLSQTIRYATRNKPTDVLIMSCLLLSTPQQATALEVQDFFIGVVVLIKTGVHCIVQRIAWIVMQPWFKINLRGPSLIINRIFVANDLFNNLYSCSNGLFTKTFCCGGNFQSICCDKSFVFDAGHLYAPPLSLYDKTSTSTLIMYSNTSVLLSTSKLPTAQTSWSILASTNKNPSSTLALLPIPSSYTASKPSTTIRLSISLLLVLLFLLSIGFFFYQERQRRIRIEGLMRKAQTVLSEIW